jgi:hypothetical protein
VTPREPEEDVPAAGYVPVPLEVLKRVAAGLSVGQGDVGADRLVVDGDSAVASDGPAPCDYQV